MSDSGMSLHTWLDIGRRLELKTLFPLPVSWQPFWVPNVGPCWQCHIWVGHGRKCVGSHWNRFASSSRSRVFPLPVFVAAILSSGCRPMSGNVGSVISASSMVENVGVAAETASPALSVQQLFPLPVFVAYILSFRCRPMSCNVSVVSYLSWAWSRMLEWPLKLYL